MASTRREKIDNLLNWLEENAFWNSKLVDVKESKFGGIGVFWKLKGQEDPTGDRLILRIPKSSILSTKNSCLINLLSDYEPTDPAIDLTRGMHAILLAFLYEQSLGERSPWHTYLDTFEIDDNDNQSLPLCLWSKEEKESLFNSECDMLNMLDPTELIQFYLECVNFAKTNDTLIKAPSVLCLRSGEEVNESHPKLQLFAKCVQAVISRAFTVDKYHGLSLVPGADLFNHILPIRENGKVVPRENVHFMCDDDEDLCDRCGEVGCDHEESDEDDEGNDDDEMEVLEEEEMGEKDDEQNGDKVEHLIEDVPLSSDSEYSEEDETNDAENVVEEDEPAEESSKQTILMEDIEQMEQSEADTDQDDEEVSTLSLSEDDDEDSSEKNYNQEHDDTKVELVQELSDSSKCCDIVLTRLPSKEHDYELFNTYGNELSNAYLLQRYGFICKNNPNTSCLLSVPMFAYLKKIKANKTNEARLVAKLEWYETIGFEMVNELSSGCDDDDCEDCLEDKPEHESCCDDGEEDEGCCREDSCTKSKSICREQEPPESWQLLPRIDDTGNPTKQTKALLHLITMPFKVFYYKLAKAPSENKMAKRVFKYLLEPPLSGSERKILVNWAELRLHRYRDIQALGPRADTIAYMIEEEKSLLRHSVKALLK